MSKKRFLLSVAFFLLTPFFSSAVTCSLTQTACPTGQQMYYTQSVICPVGGYICRDKPAQTSTPVIQNPTVSTPPKSVTNSVPIVTIKSLQFGAKGEVVLQLQQQLISIGLLSSDMATGYFGVNTRNAIRAFQKAQKITSSGTEITTGYGLFGPKTRNALLLALSSLTNTGKPSTSTSTIVITPSTGGGAYTPPSTSPSPSLGSSVGSQTPMPSPKTCPIVDYQIPKCSTDYHIEQEIDTTGCKLAPLCVKDTTHVCPVVLPPSCPNGSPISRGIDATGCSLGFTCPEELSAYPNAVIATPVAIPSTGNSNHGQIVSIGNTNVLVKYNSVVPAFDTINTTARAAAGNGKRAFQSLNSTSNKGGISGSLVWTKTEYYLTPVSNSGTIPASVPESSRIRNAKTLPSVAYQTSFTLDAVMTVSDAIILNFEGCFYDCTIYLNGKNVAQHIGGFEPFAVNISSAVNRTGSNSLVVAAKGHPLPSELAAAFASSDSNYKRQILGGYFGPSGGADGTFNNISGQWQFPNPGITQNVYLTGHTSLHVPKVLVQTTAAEDIFSIVVSNQGNSKASATLRLALDGGVSKKVKDVTLDGGGTTVVTVSVPHSGLSWRLRSAQMAKASISLVDTSNATLDTLHVPYGRRTVAVSGASFLVNGIRTFLKGINLTEEIKDGNDYRITMSRGEMQSQIFNDAQALNVNMLRPNVHSISTQFAEMADTYGLGIVDEIEFNLTSMGLVAYHQQTNNPLRFDVIDEMVWNRHNNPSVLMWSLTNEPINDNTGVYRQWLSELKSEVRKLDRQSRPITWAISAWPMPEPYMNASGDPAIADIADVISFNAYYGSSSLFQQTDINYPPPTGFEGITNLTDLQKRQKSQNYLWRALWLLRTSGYNKPVIISESGALGRRASDNPAFDETEDFESQYITNMWNIMTHKESLDIAAGFYVYTLQDTEPSYLTPPSWNIRIENGLQRIDRTRKPAFQTYSTFPIPTY